MNLPTETAADRRSQRELASARAAGQAPPEVDVKTGAMINPHNPEFITKRPWYLAEDGGVGGPSLDHQADQRREEDKLGISLSEADRLVREERERIKRKLEKQRMKEKSLKGRRRGMGMGKEDNDEGLFELGMWIEALRKNKKPYLIAQIVKISEKGKCFDLKYEDGYIERNVRPWGNKKKSLFSKPVVNMGIPRMRITRTGSRSQSVHQNALGKETYDSKRDAYHGVEIEGHMKKMEDKYHEREALRKEQRQQERERKEKEQLELKEKEKEIEKQKQSGGNSEPIPPSDSDSDYDSDNDQGNKNDGFSSSEDEVVQNDMDAKLFSTRLARQGGVGGAQMKVTARNLRIREDTAKYLRNLDPNSAYYDPKSRSMRDNPYANNAGDDADNLQQQHQAAESLGFAGDNFTRISGDAVQLAQTQLFAWDAEKKLGMEGAVHVQADPSRAELMRKKVETKGEEMKGKKRRMVLDKYGGEEYLDGNAGLAQGTDNSNAGLQKETPEERATRFGVSYAEQEYNRDGRLASASGTSTQKRRVPIPCKYDEDVHINGHTAVWGSYFHKGAFQWGYADDHSLIRSSYGTGINGRIANDESNELTYGTGVAGSAMLASARKMLDVIPKTSNAMGDSNDKFKPNQQSKLYGEAIDQHKVYDKEKLQAALKSQQEEEVAAMREGKNKRKFNSLQAEVDVTEEDMEAYRLRKGRGAEDPMANMGDGLLDYKSNN